MVHNLVGPPVRGSDLYGRDAFVELVWKKLQGGHVLLTAPRRFGKTSVMYRLKDAPQPGYHVVHADLEGLVEPYELIAALSTQLALQKWASRTIWSLSYYPRRVGRFIVRTVSEVEIQEIKVKLKDNLRPHWREAGDELFQSLSKLSKPVVFLLDEFPMMIDLMVRMGRQQEARELLRWLRSIRNTPEIGNVRFLIAGSIGMSRVLNSLGEISAINDIEQLRLEPFSQQVARDFLEELAGGERLALAPEVRDIMLELIGAPVPYFIQVLFSEAVTAHRQTGDAFDPAMIRKIYENNVLGVACKSYFDHYYGRLHTNYRPDEEAAVKKILCELAEHGSMQKARGLFLYREAAGSPDSEAFGLLMADLENDFYIRFNANTDRYEFSCKLLKDWWLRYYGLNDPT